MKVILDPLTDALIDVRCDGTSVRCGLCDPVKNARCRRQQRLEAPKRTDLPFDPIAGLLAGAREEADHA